MDPITQQTVLAAAGAAGGGGKVYVDDVFSTFLYEGTGNTRTITNGIDLDGEGGLVWIKNRDASTNHWLFDTEQSTQNSIKYLRSDSSNAGGTVTDYLTAFNSNGFDLGTNAQVNNSGDSTCAWSFRKAPGFFDVVTWNAASLPADNLVAHNLGSVPGMIICKNIDADTEWQIYHRSATSSSSTDPNAHFLQFNTNPATYSSGMASASTGWAVSSTHFRAVGSLALDNGSDNFIAYIFAHDDAQFGTDEDESIIKCGSYTGNGSTTTVNVGFEPQWLLVKASDASYGWVILDNMRGISTGSIDDKFLSANSSNEEQGQDMVDLTATGFIAKTNSSTNANNKNYIYMAIRRPNKPPEAATDVFALHSQTTPENSWTPGFVPDSLIFDNYTVSGHDRFWASRLQGSTKWLYTNTIDGEPSGNSTAYFHWDDPTNTIRQNYYQGGTVPWINYAFKRAPGFFDVVTYSGTSSATGINHNLGVVPELMLVKCRSHTESWMVYANGVGPTKTLKLHSEDAAGTFSNRWNGAPTSSVINVSTDTSVNSSGRTYVAYLFATLSGISKVGLYTGTGNAINVDCGFTNGARFVLIKRTDASGDWHVWDTTRGIVSGNDPLLRINLTSAQVTVTDWIDPLSSGFTVSSTAANDINVSGGTYIFLAIA